MPSGETPARSRPPVGSLVPRAREGTASQTVVDASVGGDARVAVGHPARPRLGKAGRERREVTGVVSDTD